MRECNICGFDKCDITKIFNRIRNGEHGPTALELQQSCKHYVPAELLKTNMFALAMFKNPQGMYDTLANIKMKIVSQGRYPYFKIVSEFSRKKKSRNK